MANRKKPTRSAYSLMTQAVGIIFITIAGMFLIAPTLMLVVPAILPSLIAIFVDRSATRFTMRSMSALNLAALVPFLQKLWTEGHNMSVARDIIADPYTWLVIYGACALALALTIVTPYILAEIREARRGTRRGKLIRSRKELIDEWGDEVAGEAPANIAN